MTGEQEKKQLLQIGKLLQTIFQETYGSIRFNLQPGRKEVSINIEECLKLNNTKQEK